MKKKECRTHQYIKEGVFPFINNIDTKDFSFQEEIGVGYFIDTEGCTEEDALQIYYCPKCGKKI